MVESQSKSGPVLPNSSASQRVGERRNSMTSMASSGDNDGAVQALDLIHRTASKTQSFTAFHEYTVPPSLTSPKESSSITGEIQSGLSGLYTRLKESVGSGNAGRQVSGEGGDTVNSDIGKRIPSSTSAQKLASVKNRNASPVPSQLSVNLETKAKLHDSPLLRPSKTSSIRGSAVSSPTLQFEFKTTDRSSKPKSTKLEGISSVAVSSEKAVDTISDNPVEEASKKSDAKKIDVDEALRAADGRLSRIKKDIEDSGASSETSSVNISRDNLMASSGTSGTKEPRSINAKSPQDEPTTPQPAKKVPSQPKQDVNQGRGKTNARQRLQFLGLTRALSSVDDTVVTSSTFTANNEDEEALSSVGKLPGRSIKSNTAQISNTILSQISNKLLGKEYWMRDENAKDCFYCGDAFSAFRRKHHCRICGQIFDSKCTTLVSGAPFGQSSTVRVCRPCEGILNTYDDSSEVSDDGSIKSGFRTRLGSNSANDMSPARSFSSLTAARTEAKYESIPSIAIPTRRLTEDSKRSSLILEIDAEPRRPGSARSLKPSLFQRSHTNVHRRMNSRHSLKLPSKLGDEISMITNGESPALSAKQAQLPAFHSDNIIDPDLADYLSDEDSSEHEQLSLAEALHGTKGSDSPKSGFGGLLLPTRKKSHLNEVFRKDGDNTSLSSTKLSKNRSLRNRNLSVSSNLNLRGSPRTHRYSVLSQNRPHLGDFPSMAALKYTDSPITLDGLYDTTSETNDTTSNDLSPISLEHVRQMLSQLLSGFAVNSQGLWEKALMPIILRASHEVVQDVQAGDDIDVRHYIKLKKIPGGRPSNSEIYSGIVFTKNLALKSMARNLIQPNILILTFPLEYARQQRHFMSLEPVIRQEREYLHNLVHRIAALKPNLLLVEHNISGLALEYLERAGISTAYNVKRSVLEAISRMAQTRIITSIDKLAIKPAQAGRCGVFYLKTFMDKGHRKTCMFLTGCPKQLGCTIVLRGGDEAILSKIKKICEFMICVAYNLKLEASFMRDEFASMRTCPTQATILPDAEPQRRSIRADLQNVPANEVELPLPSEKRQEAGAETVGGSVDDLMASSHSLNVDDADEIKLPDDTPMPTFYSDMMTRSKDTILSCSPCVKFMQPYLVVRAREQERRLMYLRSIRNRETEFPMEEKPSQFMLITPDMILGSPQNAPPKIQEVIRAVQDAQYDKAIHSYKTQKKQWEVYAAGGQDMFTPFTHQNIVVLYSIVCASTSVPCKDPKVHAIRFYNEQDEDEGFERDIPLGQYIEARCLEAYSLCSENACDGKMLDHRHQYVHGDGQLSVMITPHPPKLQGLQDIILMWSVCRICGEETQVTPMSENTWKYSWGKYLELSFWGHELYPRATSCNHDLHKEHFRYFGFRNIAVRFQYDKIALLEIVVPRTRITWKVSNDLKFKNDAFLKAEERINKFMNSVKSRLKGIHTESVLPERTDGFKGEIERLKNLAQEHHTFLIEKLRAKYMGSKYYEIIPFNRAIRAMEEKSVEWDNIFQELDQNYFPSEKDIRRLATLQLKKIFLDRDDSVESFSMDEKTANTSMTSSMMTGQTSPDDVASLISPSQLSTKDAHDMMSSVIEDELRSPEEKETVLHLSPDHSALLGPHVPDSPGISNESEVTPSNDQRPNSTAVSADMARKVSAQSDATECDHNTVASVADASGNVIEECPSPSQPTDKPDIVPKTHASNEEVKPDLGQEQEPGNETIKKKRGGFRSAIPLYRAQSQTSNNQKDATTSGSGMMSSMPSSSASNATSKRLGFLRKSSPEESKHHERKTSERFGLASLKSSISQSMIPRSTAGRRKESKVSELAKHFEALSREFERERRRDKQRATKARQSRAFPSAAAVPIIEEYRNFQEAVEIERDSLEEPNEAHDLEGGTKVAQELLQVNDTDQSPNMLERNTDPRLDEDTADDTADETADDIVADMETEEHRKHITQDFHDDDQTPIAEHHEQTKTPRLDGEDSVAEEQEERAPSPLESSELDLKIDLPKHEKSSLMKLLTNFWAERSASGWSPLEYPLNPTDHVFADSDIIVREDEPTSLIAFVLGSDAYKAKLRAIETQHADVQIPQHERFVSDHFLTAEDQAHIERSLLQSTGTHFKYQFQEGSAKMMCKVFFVEQFEAVRRKCGIDGRFIESLSQCLKWDSKGGKTKSVFLKTLDDRLVLKSLSPVETQSFVRFAPSYFTLMGEALFHDLPSVIAKMVGFFQVVIKNPNTGVEFNWFLLAMENLFYDRTPTRTFDLKGSMRNRRIQPTGEQNEVLLDENMVEYIFEKPLFSREHSKRLIAYSVFNDTLFLARQNVMDYSLMVAIDEERKELVVGIIDCVRTYTWDKKLESWMKDRGKNRPTVTSPKEYKNRFRAAMDRYVLQAPTCVFLF